MAGKDTGKALVLLSFPAIYYLMMGKGFRTYVRYAVPLTPFLCVSAAYFVQWLAGVLKDRLKFPSVTGASAVLVLIALFPSAISIVNFSRLISERDNRLVARDWITDNVPDGASIHEHHPAYGSLFLPLSLELLEQKAADEDNEDRARYYRAMVEGRSNMGIEGYALWDHGAGSGGFSYLGEDREAGPDYIIVGTAPTLCNVDMPPSLQSTLDKSYELVKSFEAIDEADGRNRFDQRDAFYLPFAGFKSITRPGPNFHVYKKK